MALVKHHSLSPLCSKLRHDHLTFHSSHFAASFSAAKPFWLPSRRRQRRAKQAEASSTRQQYAQTVALINGLEAQMAKLSDDELREKTLQFQERAKQGESLDSLLPEAFAVIIDASRRVLGLRPFDVQLIVAWRNYGGTPQQLVFGETMEEHLSNWCLVTRKVFSCLVAWFFTRGK